MEKDKNKINQALSNALNSDLSELESMARKSEAEMDEQIKFGREHHIRFLKMDRESLLTNLQMDQIGNQELTEDYATQINLALKISMLIDFMTKESLREEGG